MNLNPRPVFVFACAVVAVALPARGEVLCRKTSTGVVSVRTACASNETQIDPEESEGCFTHTPGFWGNHPAITSQFLNVEVCGVTIDNVLASNETSAIEAICSVGRDGQIPGPQVTQLVRQSESRGPRPKASGPH